MPDPRRIALFGGSFDPPHLGHLHIAQAAHDAFTLDEVRFIPCFVSPHKTGNPPTPAKHRIEMLRVATAPFPWAIVDEREISRAGPSYSWETAESFRREFPAAQLFWIMGGDQWEVLPRWAHPEKLAACVEFIVFPRNGSASTPREGYPMHLLETIHPASATVIRREIGKSSKHPWLSPALSAYIQCHGLYQ